VPLTGANSASVRDAAARTTSSCARQRDRPIGALAIGDDDLVRLLLAREHARQGRGFGRGMR
jgi:hypothetical protein